MSPFWTKHKTNLESVVGYRIPSQTWWTLGYAHPVCSKPTISAFAGKLSWHIF